MTFYMDTDPKERMFAKVVRGGVEDIYAEGEIDEGTTQRFIDFVRKNHVEAAKVHFNSPGGSLAEGMKLGRAIRTLQLFTTVGVYSKNYDPDADLDSVCASACAYAFAGGVSRFLNEYTGRLGIHQFYSDDRTSFSSGTTQQISGLIVAYLDEMGIDTRAFTISTIADPTGMIWLSPDEALLLRFANNGSAPPSAEIRLVGMIPYLRIEQDHYDVTVRVLFNCENRQLSMMFGIVTNPETSAMIASNQKRSYLALDYKDFLVVLGDKGAEATDSVVWISRSLTRADLVKMMAATDVAGWIDGFGALRYGGSFQIPTVRNNISDFAQQCFNG